MTVELYCPKDGIEDQELILITLPEKCPKCGQKIIVSPDKKQLISPCSDLGFWLDVWNTQIPYTTILGGVQSVWCVNGDKRILVAIPKTCCNKQITVSDDKRSFLHLCEHFAFWNKVWDNKLYILKTPTANNKCSKCLDLNHRTT